MGQHMLTKLLQTSQQFYKQFLLLRDSSAAIIFLNELRQGNIVRCNSKQQNAKITGLIAAPSGKGSWVNNYLRSICKILLGPCIFSLIIAANNKQQRELLNYLLTKQMETLTSSKDTNNAAL